MVLKPKQNSLSCAHEEGMVLSRLKGLVNDKMQYLEYI